MRWSLLFVLLFCVGCGKPPAGLQTLTSATFDQQVADQDWVCLVQFTMPQCAACTEMKPVIASLAKRFAGRALVGEVDLFDNGSIAMRYEVTQTPTTVLFRHGKPLKAWAGVLDEEELAKQVNEALTLQW